MSISIWKKIGRSKPVLTLIGKSIAAYLRLVHHTSKLVNDYDEDYRKASEHFPAIIGLWHGQHFMVPLVRKKDHKASALVSRSGDGEVNAIAAQSLGVEVVRGSGGRARSKTLQKGGVAALKKLVSTLKDNRSVVMTVNVPKGGARECGLGVVTLAKMSGRPIIPAAYASARRKDIEKAWDKASINLPFSHASFVIGEPIYVAADCSEEELEQKRQDVETALNAVTHKAYNNVGG
ncbi:MAG: lysophospholipid acyltransferase family protein [Cohaesibacter sp.]|nr:lysophospholipid acyltransferase family protein [Cohaesibacter sp.]